MLNYLEKQLNDSKKIHELVYSDQEFIQKIIKVIDVCVSAYRNNKKILCAGNGGSAADAQHIVAELVSRFYFDRPALSAEALTVNTSILTAIGNDYSYDYIFARQIEANGNSGDVFIALSTSGNSLNIISAINAAKSKGMIVIGLTGASGGKMKDLCDYFFLAPSQDTPRIQEIHILIGHLVCAGLEKALFENNT